MNRRSLLKYTYSLCSLLLLSSFASVALAQEDDNSDPTVEQIQAAAKPPKLESNVFDTGSVVRRKLLYRSTRFEASPFIGLTLNDAYNRNIMPGINLNYHLTNDLGISASFAYGVMQWDTDLKKNFVSALKNHGTRGEEILKSTDFMKLQFFADLGLAYVPFYGKSSIFGATLNWDFHLVGGVVILKQQAYNVIDKPAKDSTLDGIKPGGVLQLGVRLFFGDFVALNLDLRNFIYSSSDSTKDNASNAEITDKLFFSLGVSFFFPTDVKISW